jgi:AcrR family transcriptional regulator
MSSGLLIAAPTPRATRDAGRRTRGALLNAASTLFAERGLARVSLGDIATEAGAFPSQVTYYFGSKEALFVEAASREVLHLAESVEVAGSRAASRPEYARVMAHEALSSPALLTFAEALLLARQRPELEPLVARTLDRLHAEGARAVSARCAAAGWPLWAPPEAVARGFWALVLGLVLSRAGGGAFDLAAAEAAVLATLSVAYPRDPAAPAGPAAASSRPARRSGAAPRRRARP